MKALCLVLLLGTSPLPARAAAQTVEACREKGVVGLAHGLNNPPSIMGEIAAELVKEGFETTLLELSGHRDDSPLSEMRRVSAVKWISEFQNFMLQVQSRAKECSAPAHFVGYSMGALLHAHYLSTRENFRSDGNNVYLAPALKTHNFTRLVTWLPLWNTVVLPSFNHPTAIAQEGSSMAAFRALFEIQNAFNDNASTALKQHRTLILIDPKDELVSYSKTEALLEKLTLQPAWQQQAFTPSEKAKEDFKHHLFLTRQSAGGEAFTKLIHTIVRFLSTSKN